jgi:adenylate cyclase class IV
MAINKRKEVEVKFYAGHNHAALIRYRKLLVDNGYKLISKRIETDYLPDSEKSELKTNGLLFRLRLVEEISRKYWVITVKKRSMKSGVLDFEEIETRSDLLHIQTLNHITKTIEEQTGAHLDLTKIGDMTLDQVRDYIHQNNLTKNRILLDKYREEYAKGDTVVTLDTFPEKMGSYIEVETFSIKQTTAAFRELGFKKMDVITTDYGDLLKLSKSDTDDENQRRSLFESNERTELLGESEYGKS